MALRTAVNSRITDAVTQSNLATLGLGPSIAMGSVFQSLAHSLSIMFQNSVQAQAQMAMTGQAAAVQGVLRLYGQNSVAAAVAAGRVGRSDTATQLLTLIVALELLKKNKF